MTPANSQPVQPAERFPLFDHFRMQRLERIEAAAKELIRAKTKVHEHKQTELDGWTPQVAAWQDEHHDLCQAEADSFVALSRAVGHVEAT